MKRVLSAYTIASAVPAWPLYMPVHRPAGLSVFSTVSVLLLFMLLACPSFLTALNMEHLSSVTLSNFELPDVEQRNCILFVTAGPGGTTVVDARDPYNPVQTDRYYDAVCAFDRLYNTAVGDQPAAGAGRSCPILTISDDYEIDILSRHRTGTLDHEDVAIAGESLLTAAACGRYGTGETVTIHSNDTEKDPFTAPLPHGFLLRQNFPDPFNPSTTIRLEIDEGKAAEFVDLSIYDLRGKSARTLVADVLGEGRHTVIRDGTDQYATPVPSGVYFSRLRIGDSTAVRKMLLTR